MVSTRYRNVALIVALTLSGGLSGGCSGSSGGAPVTQDTVVATPSVTGTTTATVGGSRSLTLTFTSSDVNSILYFSVKSGLSSKPAGWSGPSDFACATVSTGSGCVLTLTYAPTAAGSGTLTLGYGYVNSAGVAKTGTMAIPYAATVHNTVAATAVPTGQISVVSNASEAVSLTFTTDDGQPATALSVTSDLAGLPPGWSSSDHRFACATVSTGSGCLLPLTFAPTAPASGTLTLTYGYTDSAGTAKTGTASIAYAATAPGNHVVGTAAPAGQIAAVTGGSQSVSVTFTTDDHLAATALAVTSDLTALPSGWSASASTFSCSSVSTGNGCQLNLTYTPTAPATGTLTLAYGYHDSKGAPQTGTLNLAYTATAHNNVIGTAAPSGQINAALGSGSQAVNITFTTDNSTATALSLTTALNSLPSGWTSTASSFTCSSVASSGNGCQLPLTYSPSSVGSGTLTLHYAYTNNAGVAATGTVGIPYAATANDHIVGTVAPSGTVSVATNGSVTTTVTFATDDGNIASALAISNSGAGGIGSLPAGWTVSGGAGSFSCNSVSTGTGCQLALTYAPTAAATGSVTLNYSYVNNSGVASTGTVSIPYAAVNRHAYILDYNHGVYVCSLSNTGAITSCASTGSGFANPTAIAFSPDGGYAYVANNGNSTLSICTVAGDGSGNLTCSTTIPSGPDNSGYGGYPRSPNALAVQGNYAYVANGNGGNSTVASCQINGAGLNTCIDSDSALDGVTNYLAIGGNYAYVGLSNSSVEQCSIVGDGTLGSCQGLSLGYGSTPLTVSGGYLYFASSANMVDCVIDGSTGSISNSGCTTTSLATPPSNTAVDVGAVAIAGNTAYVVELWTNFNTFSQAGTGVYQCADTAGVLSGCVLQSPSGYAFTTISGIAIQ